MSPSPIQFYDVLMLAVILVTTFLGARKGMAWQLAALASLVVSAFVAVRFSAVVAPYVGNDPQWNRYVAMLVLYLGTSLGIWLAFRLVSGIIDRVKLQGLDRQMGGLFGFTKGVLLCLVITFFAVTLSEWARQNILNTNSGHYITVLLQKGTPLLPDEVRGVLGKYIAELEAKLAKDGPPSPDLSPKVLSNGSPGAAIPDIIRRELSPTAAPAATVPNSASSAPNSVSPAPPQPPLASTVSLPLEARLPVYAPPAVPPPAIPSQAFGPPAYPPNYPPAVLPTQQPPDFWDGRPVPKGLRRVP